jgi:hypothetical protein
LKIQSFKWSLSCRFFCKNFVYISLGCHIRYIPHPSQNNQQIIVLCVCFFFLIFTSCVAVWKTKYCEQIGGEQQNQRVPMFTCIFDELCIHSVQLFSNETFIFCASAGLVLILCHQEAVVCRNATCGTRWTRTISLIDGGILCIIPFTVDLIDRGTIRVRIWELYAVPVRHPSAIVSACKGVG